MAYSYFDCAPLFLLFISAFFLARRWRRARFSTKVGAGPGPSAEKRNQNGAGTSDAEIESLPDFDWKTTKPLQFRPFKPKYHLTMAVERSSVSELIEMDCNYLERIKLRESIIRDYPDTVLAAEPASKPAIDEFYMWLLGTYLPTRYPTMFSLVASEKEGRKRLLRSLVTGEEFAIDAPEDPKEALRRVGRLVDDDVLFLVRSEDGDGFTLRGFVTCCPNGFDTSKKLNLKLRDIHTPIPGYKAKLEKSMDRFFDRLEPGRYVKRANWTVTTTDQVFTPSGNHLYEGEEVPQEDVDISKARLRCERQVVHRLPQSGAIVFSFKTYLYPITDIKAEGLGEDLAQAIDGLRSGTVPGFHWYKRAAVWGEAVKAYLLSPE